MQISTKAKYTAMKPLIYHNVYELRDDMNLTLIDQNS